LGAGPEVSSAEDRLLELADHPSVSLSSTITRTTDPCARGVDAAAGERRKVCITRCESGTDRTLVMFV
jgi:hypothetical protein